MRTLVYRRDAGFFRFASVPRGIFADPDVPREVDLLNVARQAARRPLPADEILFKGVAAVPPGCAVTLRGDRVGTMSYWSPDRIRPVRYRHAGDYVDGLRSVLETAVAAQTRSAKPVASQLSGGLDSGAVTALAARVLAGKGTGLVAYTAAPRVGFMADPAVADRRVVDESALAARTAALYPNVRHVVLRDDRAFDLGILDQVALGADQPARNPINMPWIEAIARDAARGGAGVLLGGELGNLTASYDGAAAIASLLLRGRPIASAKGLLAFRKTRALRFRMLFHMVSAVMARRLRLPPEIRQFGRKRLSGVPDNLARSALRPDWAAAVQRAPVWSWPRCRALEDGGLRAASFANNDRANLSFQVEAVHGLSLRDPTADRRVVEYCWGIPVERFLHGGMPRGLMKAAMAGLLPPEVLDERRRGQQAADWRRQLSAAREELGHEIDRLAATPACAGLIDTDRLHALVAGLGDETDANSRLLDFHVTLMQAVTAGRFLRRHTGSNA